MLVLIVSVLLQISLISGEGTIWRNIGTEDDVVLLGGLFPVHGGSSCSKIQDYGFQRAQAMAFAVEMINNNTELLPNITLGYDLRDTCSNDHTALEASLDFVVDVNFNNDANSSYEPGISGVVGSASSSESTIAASLLGLFDIPQISYASTANKLSNKETYKYFLRTLPPDIYQADVLVDVVVHFGWTYIIAISSDDVYGREGMEEFVNLLSAFCSNSESKNNTDCESFCTVGRPISIPREATQDVYDNEIKAVLSSPWKGNATVIVIFGQPQTAEGVLSATQKLNASMTLVASDGAGDNLPTKDYQLAHGMIAVVPEYTKSEHFDEYFTSLNSTSNGGNPWFTEYLCSIINCTLDNSNDWHPLANNPNYQQNSKVPFVLDAVYAFAHAIHNMLEMVCGEITLCENAMVERYGRKVINGKILLQYLKNVTFKGFSTDRIKFDENGDQLGGYLINNLQMVDEGEYEFIEIGNSNSSHFQKSSQFHTIQWGIGNRAQPVSMCSNLCLYGEFREPVENEMSCCWTCEKCKYNEFSDGVTCETCPEGTFPNNEQSNCTTNSDKYLQWGDVSSIFILTFANIGILCTLITAAVFTILYKHKIVKAASRELSAVLLTGLVGCFVIPFFAIGKPTPVTCGISRLLFGISFSLCYAPLLVKTNRIHRIFNRNISSKKRPPLISPQSQLFFTFLLVSVQVVISGVWLVAEPPGTKLIYHDDETEITCSSTSYVGIVVSLSYNIALLVASVYFAFRTRNIPQNFNETRFINITVYSVIIIWLGFIPTYIAISSVEVSTSFVNASQLLAITLNAFVILSLFFFSKIYFIISAKSEQLQSETGGTESYIRGVMSSVAKGMKSTPSSVDEGKFTREEKLKKLSLERSAIN